MQGVSNKKHRAMIAALRQLRNLLDDNAIPHNSGGTLSNPADGWMALEEKYKHYRQLLEELAACIQEYEKLHHHLKIHVLAPALRQAKKQAGISRPSIEPYRAALEYVEVVRAI